MAVNKQTYVAIATWTASQLADLFRQAFQDAGLMADWHDSFSGSNSLEFRVLKINHDSSKQFGTSYYMFSFRPDTGVGVSLSSGWNVNSYSPFNTPAGTQYLDYRAFPSAVNSSGIGNQATNLTQILSTSRGTWSTSPTSSVFLDRYTSAADPKQSWFVLRQGTNQSPPFTILHKDTVLQSWVDLDRSMISGLVTAHCFTAGAAGYVNFRLQENLRRCLGIGQILRGQTDNSGFHNAQLAQYAYVGCGSRSAAVSANSPSLSSGGQGGAVALPVGMNNANPAYPAGNYSPIVYDVAWCPYTETRLPADLGIYFHYADNVTAYYDSFVITPALNEWKAIDFANNATVTDGASATFLVRVV